ncbi:uncharacterized protein LOC111355276 [Spodoptera litura]|uniref:Uncharacterized protein LOC111355276 n=1 Tax=Spodoptera litura TaxID=69820 RepID=A0A9J7E9V9_SPOLT|nr:uncharacterized protein LOC111355276 [Spodoptera litura]
MNKFIPVLLLCYICVVAFIIIDVSEANDTKVLQRNRRYLSFLNMTRFYLKFNFKANIIPWNQLFAQAIGFRMNWDGPPSNFRPFHRIYRREIYDYVETLLDKNGLEGFHCVRRAICEIQMIAEPNMIYHKLLKMVFRKMSPTTERWHNVTTDECTTSITICPLSLLQVSPYTDIM